MQMATDNTRRINVNSTYNAVGYTDPGLPGGFVPWQMPVAIPSFTGINKEPVKPANFRVIKTGSTSQPGYNQRIEGLLPGFTAEEISIVLSASMVLTITAKSKNGNSIFLGEHTYTFKMERFDVIKKVTYINGVLAVEINSPPNISSTETYPIGYEHKDYLF